MASGDQSTTEIDPKDHRQGSVFNWLGFAQFIWALLITLTLSLFFADLPWQYERMIASIDPRSLAELRISTGAYAAYQLGLNLVVILAHVFIAGVIFIQRPNDRMALFVSMALVANGAMIPLAQAGVPGGINPSVWEFLVNLVTTIGLISSVALTFLFPDGRFVPRWTRWLTAGWALLIIFALFSPNSAIGMTTWPIFAQLITLLGVSIAGIYAQAYRFSHVSTPLQRQQTKWAFLGLAAALFGPLVYFLSAQISSAVPSASVPNILYQRVGASFFAFSLLARMFGSFVITVYLFLFPISFAIAVLRYRLWDIDILIRRTLIYSVFTTLLLFIYFGSVLFMQTMFILFTGQGSSELVTVISTLAIAGLFVPLRDRVQEGIDRRFYRHKYDAEQTLAAFAAGLREEVDLDQLSARLISVVEETMQPTSISLWLAGSDNQRGP
jgi:hypothetical protein